MISSYEKNISEFEGGATVHGNVTVPRRARTSLKKEPNSSRAGLDSSQPIGGSAVKLDKINPRPKSVLGLVRVGGREEEWNPSSASQVSIFILTKNKRNKHCDSKDLCLTINLIQVFFRKGMIGSREWKR
jgi:hypothetical protein